MTKAEKDADPTEQRWVLLRDVGVLQAKLLPRNAVLRVAVVGKTVGSMDQLIRGG